MSLELKDFRGKLTVEGWAAVDAEAEATGKERAEIVREIVHQWALGQIRKASVLHKTLEREGLTGNDVDWSWPGDKS